MNEYTDDPCGRVFRTGKASRVHPASLRAVSDMESWTTWIDTSWNENPFVFGEMLKFVVLRLLRQIITDHSHP